MNGNRGRSKSLYLASHVPKWPVRGVAKIISSSDQQAFFVVGKVSSFDNGGIARWLIFWEVLKDVVNGNESI